MQAIAQVAEVLSRHNTRVVFICSSTTEQMEEFLRDPVVPVSGDMYTDPSVALYNVFQMKRGRFRSLVMPLLSAVTKYGFSGILEGIRLGAETSHLAGDSWIQGGTVLLNHKAAVLYQHQEEHPADWPDMSKVFNMIGVNDEQVDYNKAVSDWMEARSRARK